MYTTYHTGQNIIWAYWMRTAFSLSQDPAARRDAGRAPARWPASSMTRWQHCRSSCGASARNWPAAATRAGLRWLASSWTAPPSPPDGPASSWAMTYAAGTPPPSCGPPPSPGPGRARRVAGHATWQCRPCRVTHGYSDCVSLGRNAHDAVGRARPDGGGGDVYRFSATGPRSSTYLRLVCRSYGAVRIGPQLFSLVCFCSAIISGSKLYCTIGAVFTLLTCSLPSCARGRGGCTVGPAERPPRDGSSDRGHDSSRPRAGTHVISSDSAVM